MIFSELEKGLVREMYVMYMPSVYILKNLNKKQLLSYRVKKHILYKMENRMNSVVIFNAWHTCLVSTSLLWRGSRWRRGCRWRPRPGQTRPRTQSRRATCGGYAHQPPGHSGTPVAEIISIIGILTSIWARLSVCCSDCHNFKFHFPCSYLSSC